MLLCWVPFPVCWSIRQEGDCGLSQKSWESGSFCLKLHRAYTIPGPLKSHHSFLRLSAARVLFRLPTHLLSSWSEPTARAAPGLRGQADKKRLCSKMKRRVPLYQLCVPTFTHHQPPYVGSLMLRGRMVRTLVSLSCLPLTSTIPAAVYASQPQGPKRLLDSSSSLCGCSPWEVH